MSVINRMLQDLDRRRASGEERKALPVQARPLAGGPPRSSRWAWALGLAALAVIAGLLYWGLRPSPRAAPQAPAGQPGVAPPPSSSESGLPDAASLRFSERLGTTSVFSAKKPQPREPAPLAEQKSPAVPLLSLPQPPPPAAIPAPAPPPPLAAKEAVPPPRRPAEKSPQPSIDKQLKQVSPSQRAENEFRRGTQLLHQGRQTEAQTAYRAALEEDPAHRPARQALLGLLLEAKKSAEAEQLLEEGLKVNPAQPGFAMALARLQADRADLKKSIDTLQRTLPQATGNADYWAMLAALLQKDGRHGEAITHYQAALRLKPQSGVWFMGLGISLEAEGRRVDARAAFQRAQATQSLSPDLQAFVEQRLRELEPEGR